MSLDDGAGDRKPGTRASGAPVAVRLQAHEPLEDAIAIDVGDAGPVVPHGETDASGVSASRPFQGLAKTTS